MTQAHISDFTPDPSNANRGTERGRALLEQSLRQYGAGRSVLVDRNGRIIAGNKTLQTAGEIGLEDVIVVQTDGKQIVAVQRMDLDLANDEAARMLAYADNRVGQIDLDFDPAQLLADMTAGLPLDDFWRQDELDALLAEIMPKPEPPEDPGPQPDRAEELAAKWQTADGQIWQIGEHYAICGDCREPDTWSRLLSAAGVDKVNGVFTSSPYAEQRKEQYGGVPTAEYVDWWEAVQANVRGNLADDGSFFVNIKPHAEDTQRNLYVFDLVCAMVRQWNWLFVDEYCWLRNGIPQQVINRFKNNFEPVYWFAASDNFKFHPKDVRHYSDNVPVPLGPGAGDTNAAKRQGTGRGAVEHTHMEPGMAYPSNVIDFARSGAGVIGHAAAFPVALPDFFIRAYSDPGDVWLDPFLGSGTTIVAAHQNKRRGLGSEKLPKYLGVILERLEQVTSCTPVLVGA